MARFFRSTRLKLLSEARYQSSRVLRCLDDLRRARQNLVASLKAAIDGDEDTLKGMRPIKSYYE